jgi:hypothetical protein
MALCNKLFFYFLFFANGMLEAYYQLDKKFKLLQTKKKKKKSC